MVKKIRPTKIVVIPPPVRSGAVVYVSGNELRPRNAPVVDTPSKALRRSLMRLTLVLGHSPPLARRTDLKGRSVARSGNKNACSNASFLPNLL